jgi:hypothetical protein
MDTITVIPTDVVLLPERCYRCGHTTWPVVGLWFDRHTIPDGFAYLMTEHDGGWFLEYDHETAAVIAIACPDQLLAEHGAGPLRWRTTRAVPDGYLANTCGHCGTVLGNWPLHEAVTEFLAEGGSLDELLHVPSGLPGDALDQLEE